MINTPSQSRAGTARAPASIANDGAARPGLRADTPTAPATNPRVAATAAPIYLGIDVAKAELVMAVRDNGRTSQPAAYANTPAGIAKLMRRVAKDAGDRPVVACLEATGTYGEAAATALHHAGHTVAVVNPAMIRDFMRSLLRRNKTDAADAAAIAEFAERMNPRPWQPRAPEREALRQMVCARDHLVQQRGDNQRRLKSGACRHTAALWRAQIAFINRQIAQVEADIAAHIQAHPPLAEQMRLLTSIPGISNILGAAALATIDFQRFDNARQVCAFIGTCPSRHQSGPSAGSTRINKQGHSLLRRLAYMGALSAMRYNPHIKQCAARWQSPERKGNGRALTPKQTVGAAMNKLARQMFGVLKSGQPYQPCQPIAA